MREFQKRLEACMQNDPPPCGAGCPFGLDVRDFAAKLKRGSFRSAYRAYANAVGFPAIVSRLCSQPCKAGCVYAGAGSAVDLLALERAVVAYTPNAQPNRYSLPRKEQKVAIVGAGPCGLACALRLAAKNYPVVIFDREERIGGSLWSCLPQEEFLPELERQLMYVEPEFCLGREITDLAEAEADAILIATGQGGCDFGQVLSGEGAFATGTSGVFLAGGLVGRDPVSAIADGLFAAAAVERYLKTGGMNEPVQDFSTRFRPDPALYPKTEAVAATGTGGLFTREEAVAEANRCRECRCDACVRMCDLMRGYQKYPKRIEEEVVITIDPVSLSRNARVATRLIATCNHCGLCKQVCPASIDTGAFLLESHGKMHEKDAMPWAFHEFWLRDMEFSQTEASLCLAPEGEERPKYLFFPGCRLGGSDPELVQKGYEALCRAEPSSGLLLSCCGAPAEWAGEETLHAAAVARLRESWEGMGRPKLVFACMNCRKEFAAYLPEAEGVSLYELLAEAGEPAVGPAVGKATVFDPCAGRDCPGARAAVRKLAAGAGAELEALPMEGEYARCCGWGGQVELANPGYAQSVTRSRAEESSLPYLVYCANCRDMFAKQGKRSAHILELLEGGTPDWERPAPTATQARENRRLLKRRLLERFGKKEEAAAMEKGEQSTAMLLIGPALLEKMGKDYLLREDAEAAVCSCEERGEYLEDTETGSRLGHARVGRMTLWVQYRDLEGCRELLNIYAHRMEIVEGDGSV